MVDEVIGANWLPYAKAQLARIHAIWALTRLGQVAALAPLLSDADPEFRAQAARAFGEAGDASQVVLLSRLCGDLSPRVRALAVTSLGKIATAQEAPVVTGMVADASPSDPWQRQAGALAMSRLLSVAELAHFATDDVGAVRMAALLALRQLRSEGTRVFLEDAELQVGVEAARAIWDCRIEGAYRALADQAARTHELPQPYARRALAAANHLGRAEDAAAIYAYLMRADVDPKLKEDCVEYVREWTAPKEFDRILNESFTHPDGRARDWFAGKELGFLTRQELDTVARGEKVFRENMKATCMKCHSVGGSAVTAASNEAGPDLSNVGLRLTTEQLRKSILDPTDTIAAGFEKFDAAGALVKESAMTVGLGAALSKEELDDLVAFLAQQQKVRKILIHVESAGFEHSVAKVGDDGLSMVERQWQAWDAADPRFEVIVDRSNGWASEKELEKLDAVFFYTTGELDLDDAQRRALMDWIRAGGGFSGSHCATDTFYQWEDYGRMIGGYFDGHPWHEKVGVRVENPSHVSTRHLNQPVFIVLDEIYQQKDPWSRDTCAVLLSLDLDSTNMQKQGINRADRDFGIAWTRREGEGRVFYTALGHREDVWESPWFRDHLVEGTLWVAE
ncbi:MAG: ThuA domain-containing protein [Planctomycetota bacterium]|nr:ThuA domain-containing protein [Planctomycetota bacterium]